MLNRLFAGLGLEPVLEVEAILEDEGVGLVPNSIGF